VGTLTNHADAVSQFVWQQLSPDVQAGLHQAPDSHARAVVLAEQLNRIVHNPALYDPNSFAGVKLSEDTRLLITQVGQGMDPARLNRSLLEDAFPAHLARHSQLEPFARLWQLTNTRRVLGMKGFLEVMNQQLDPANHSFRVEAPFDFGPRPSASTAGGTRVEDITAGIRPDGQFAIFQFGAALPRTKLFSQWEVVTNDTAALQRLADPAFNPQNAVVLADVPPGGTGSAGTPTGTADIVQYEPKHVTVKAQAGAPSILLLNDKFDPNWKVKVDGKPDRLLRCNYIMRGVYLQPGPHLVEFAFDPPHWTLYVSLAAIAIGLGLCGVLAFGPSTRPSVVGETAGPATVGATPNPKSKI